MTTRITGFRTVGAEIDEEGYRTYHLTTLIETDDPLDGPLTVMTTAGLPVPGTQWSFGNDYDPWSFCYPSMRVSIHDEREGDPTYYWAVEQTFSNKPLKRCQDSKIEDPLLEPMKISGSWVKKQREATFNRFGTRILSSSFEPIKGNVVEFDECIDTVTIEQNVPLLGLPTFTAIKNNVNDRVLWGMAPRTIKFSNVSWERQIFGQCGYYYTRKLEFEIDANTWDRDVPDEGDKMIDGYWLKDSSGDWNYQVQYVDRTINDDTIDPSDPRNFIRAKDPHDQPFHVQLNGYGAPLKFGDAPVKIHVEKYPETNLLILGIPTTLGV